MFLNEKWICVLSRQDFVCHVYQINWQLSIDLSKIRFISVLFSTYQQTCFHLDKSHKSSSKSIADLRYHLLLANNNTKITSRAYALSKLYCFSCEWDNWGEWDPKTYIWPIDLRYQYIYISKQPKVFQKGI